MEPNVSLATIFASEPDIPGHPTLSGHASSANADGFLNLNAIRQGKPG
jgi:hypothetical protein